MTNEYRKEFNNRPRIVGSSNISAYKVTQFLEMHKYKKADNGDDHRCKNCDHSHIIGVTKSYKKYMCMLLGMKCKASYRCKNFQRGDG